MDRMIYSAMSGAKATMARQDSLANNLANANTTGFRAEMVRHRAVPIQGDGASTRVFALDTTLGYSDKQGEINITNRELDVAVSGSGWIAVQGLDGNEAYTRNGSLDVDGNGQLVTRNGLPVLGDGGPINVPANARIKIGQDGTVTATVGNGAPQQVGRIKLTNPETVSRGPDGLFRTPDGEAAPLDESVRVTPAALEGSNVNVIEQMVGMISAARQYELQMKMMTTADASTQRATRLLSPTG